MWGPKLKMQIRFSGKIDQNSRHLRLSTTNIFLFKVIFEKIGYISSAYFQIRVFLINAGEQLIASSKKIDRLKS